MGKLIQLEAALRKNGLQKKRNLRITLCEALSPLFLILMLSYGYFMSDVESFRERNYAQFKYSIPKDILPIVEPFQEDDVSLASFKGVNRLIKKIMKGPLPPPTFDQYVLVSNAISRQIDQELYDRLLGDTEIGRRFGNLVSLGTLHLAPHGSHVDAFVAYASKHTATFGKGYFKHRVHETENKAVEWIDAFANPNGKGTNERLNANATAERAWGLVVFNTLEPGRVDYTLRLNYSTVPHTGFLSNSVAIGLDDQYQSYYLSGFFSLSKLVDDFAFEHTATNPPARTQASGIVASVTNAANNASPATRACTPPSWIGVPFPTAAYDQNFFYLASGYLLGLIMTMSTLYPLSRLVKDLVEEKESRMRETMAAMGMNLGINCLAWWLTATCLFTWLAAAMTFTAKLSFFPRSDTALVFAFFELLLVSEVSLSFLVAACFSQARLASIVGPVVLFMAALPRYVFFGSNRYDNTFGKKLASVSSVAAFCFGADIFSDYEYAEVGVSWDNYTEGDYSLWTALVAMAVDSVVYLVLAVYLEAVLPTQYGSPRHPLFFLSPLLSALAGAARTFTPAYVIVPEEADAEEEEEEEEAVAVVARAEVGPFSAKAKAAMAGMAGGGGGGGEGESSGRPRHQLTEIEPVDKKILGPPAVRIVELVKDYRAPSPMGAALGVVGNAVAATAVFLLRLLFRPWLSEQQREENEEKGSKKRRQRRPAVDGLSLDLWPGQVTCLLGHNGAGKSSTVSVLTGLTPPTSGDCLVLGRSIARDLSAVRQQLGVCPQTNVLFPSLTVSEHLYFFARVKGVGRGRAMKSAVDSAIAEVGLTEKVHAAAASLSGGMKRKLCLAMALIGDPTVVLLDEPTSGMDPYSRRATWDLVRRAKLKRVVVLTTHFMDEAEVLGDRVAIMSNGRLRCVGSPLWLKARFGIGYNLSITLVNDNSATTAAASDAVSFTGGAAAESSCTMNIDDVDDDESLERNQTSVHASDDDDPFAAGLERSISGTGAGSLAHTDDPFASGLERSISGTGAGSLARTDDESALIFLGLVGKQRGGVVNNTAASTAKPPLLQQEREETKEGGDDRPADVADLVLRHVPSAEVVSRIAREVTFRLPRVAASSFVALFDALESTGRESLGVGAFGMGLTTLEEVFIRIAEEDEAEEDSDQSRKAVQSTRVSVHANSSGDCGNGRGNGGDGCDVFETIPEIKSTYLEPGSPCPAILESDKVTSIPPLAPGPQQPQLQRPGPIEEVRILFGKRATVFRRDLKGGFFQLGVPLMVVASIMSILTVKVQPAGPSLRGLPSAFRKRSASSVAVTSRTLDALARSSNVSTKDAQEANGDFCTSSLIPKLKKELSLNLPRGSASQPKPPSWINELLFPATSNTTDFMYDLGEISNSVSEHLLDTNEGYGHARFGAYVSEDRIPVSITLNWRWMFDLLPEIFAAATSAGGIESIEQLILSQAPFIIASRQVTLAQLLKGCDALDNQLTAENTVDIGPTCTALGVLPTDGLALDLDANDVLSSEELEEFIVDGLNTTFGLNSEAIQDLLDSITTVVPNDVFNNESSLASFFDLLSISFAIGGDNETMVTLPSVNLDFRNVDIAEDGTSIKLIDITVGIRGSKGGIFGNTNTTLLLGNYTLSLTQLIAVARQFLNGTSVYKFDYVSPMDLTVLHNSSSWHALYMFHGFARQAAYADRCFETPNPSATYVVRNHPLPLTTGQVLEIRFILSVLTSLFLLIVLGYVPAAFVSFVVKERECKSKHLQLVSGANVFLYWMATYLWDSFLFLLFTLCFMGVLNCYGDELAMLFLYPFEAAVCTFLLVFFFGLSTLPFNYVLSFAFDNHNQALISIRVINFMTGFVATMIFVVMFSIEATQELALILRKTFLIFPPYHLGEGLLRLSRSFYINNVLGGNQDIFSWDVAGSPLVYMASEAIGYIGLTLMLETRYAKIIPHAIDQVRVESFFGQQAVEKRDEGEVEVDEDVADEATRVLKLHAALQKQINNNNKENEGSDSSSSIEGEQSSIFDLSPPFGVKDCVDWSEATILLKEIQKVYPPPITHELSEKVPSCKRSSSSVSNGPHLKHAVRGLSLAVPKGETFGFLGINGAGKTTTLSMLTGDLLKTRGEALVNGEDVGDPSTQRNIGYCPQEDPLLEQMTGEETLLLFARLKGVGGGDGVALLANIRALLARVGLIDFKDEPCGSYSGGMKRKLSFAVALVGEPPVLLLDEPSTGMGERKEESSINVGVGVFLFFILYCAFRVGLNYPGSANVR